MKRMSRYTLGGLLTAVGLFVAFNLGAGPLLRTARLDLTQNHLNTLSKGTIHILEHLDKPVTLQLYWSGKEAANLPGLRNYAERVKEMLDEYANIAGDKLKLQVIDPEPFSVAEDNAMRYGLQAVPTNGGPNIYFGLVGLGQKGKPQTIPFFQQSRSRFLEYDITQLIYTLDHPKKPEVALLSGLNMSSGFSPYGMGQPWLVLRELHQQFTLRQLPRQTKTIPKGVDALMVVQPQRLDATTLYAIDQYVLRGGRALVFTDPLAESAGGGMGQAVKKNPAADKLLASWGVKLVPGKVVGDLGAAQKVQFTAQDGQPTVADYLPWLKLTGAQLNSRQIITSQLGQLNLATAGALQAVPGAGTTLVPLMHSTARAMLIARSKVAFNPNPQQLLANFHASGHPYVLAALLSGKIKTAFPGGPPAPPKGKQAKPEHHAGKDKKKQPATAPLKVSAKPVHLVVVADTDLLQDRFWVRQENFFGRQVVIPEAGNGDFVINTLDQLGGSPDLISVRSRGNYQRPFTLVQQLQAQAEQQYQTKEQQLLSSLHATQRKLNELQSKRKDAKSASLSPAQKREIHLFRLEMVHTRKRLRAVQYKLRADIEELESALKAFNILFVPGLIGLIAFFTWLIRRHRSRGYPS